MMICRVTGEVVAPVQNPRLEGHRLLVVRPLDRAGRPRGRPQVAVDRVDAGIGDRVLVNREGGSARLVLRDARIPVQSVIVGVVDDVVFEEERPG